jgi:O-antigen ligase
MNIIKNSLIYRFIISIFNIYKNSFIFTIISKFSNFLRNSFEKSFLCKQITDEKRYQNSFVYKTIKAGVELKLKIFNKIGYVYSESVLYKVLKGSFILKNARVLGTLLVLFALGIFEFLPFAIIYVLVLLYSLFELSAEGKLKYISTNIYFAFMLYAIATIVFSLSSYDMKNSIVYAAFNLFTMSFILIGYMINNKKELEKVLTGFSISIIGLGIYSVYQFLFVDTSKLGWVDDKLNPEISTRVFATMGNPNQFAEYLVLALPILIALFFAAKKMSTKAITFVAVGAGLVSLVLTYSRAGYLAFFVGALVFVLCLKMEVLFSGVLVLPLALMVLPKSMLSRIATIGNMKDTSVTYRVDIWEAATRMINEHFYTGIGYSAKTFELLYPYYRGWAPVASHAHNSFLETFVEMGVIGFIIFLFLNYTIVKEFISGIINAKTEYTKIMLAGCLASFTGILCHSMFEHTWFYWRNLVLIWVVVGIGLAVIKFDRETN